MKERRRNGWAWAAIGALLFVAVAVRTLVETPPTFVQGDLALLHVDSLRATGFRLLLGPYDRFGWHHPGPAYAYLMSIADRAVGAARPLQAEALTALAINGASLAGAAVAARRRLGAGAAAGVLAFGWLAVVELGNDAVFNPWSPTVVVLPSALIGVLAVSALARRPPLPNRAAGSEMAVVVAAALVVTFCLQTDLGTLPLAVPAAALVVAAPLVARLIRRRYPGPTAGPSLPSSGTRAAWTWSAVAVAAGGLIALAAWIPVLDQELSSDPGNLTRIVRFFTAGHRHAGLAAGARAAGWAQLAVLGHRPPGAPPVGGAGSWATLGAASAAGILLAVGLRIRRPSVTAGAVVWLVGTGLAVLAGAEVVGPAYSYLTYWAAAPLVGGAVAVGDLTAGIFSERRRSGVSRVGTRETALLLVSLLGGLAVTGAALSRRGVVSYSQTSVATAWSEVSGLVPVTGAVGVAYPNQPATWNVGTGLVDRLEAGGHPVAVLPFWANQVATTSDRPPSRWISVLPVGFPPPGAAWRTAGTVGDVRLVVGPRPAPGTG